MVKIDKKIYVYDNADKSDHEKFMPNEPTYMLHPFTACFIAPTSHGKSNLIANIILDAYRVNKPFQRILLCHYLGSLSREYDMFSDMLEILPEVPSSVDELNLKKGEKTALIFEDIDVRNLKQNQKTFIDRAMGCISSHMGCSVFISAQQCIAIPVGCRRMMHHCFIWKPGGQIEDIVLLARKAGIRRCELEYYFEHACQSKYDCIHINYYNTDAPRITKNLHHVLRQ